MPWSVATIIYAPPLRRKRSFASHASQTSSIRDNQLIVADRALHLPGLAEITYPRQLGADR
jgi:hypothetical protein